MARTTSSATWTFPRTPTATPVYKGPYTGEGQAEFDKAVTCDGNTITYRFKKPWPDFPLAIASLRSFDPYRADQDKGDKSEPAGLLQRSLHARRASGTRTRGGTFIRNPEWDGTEDTNREANPDSFVFQVGIETEVIIDRLIADEGDDANAFTTRSMTPAQYPQITGEVAERAVNFESPFSNYLLPNFNRITNLQGPSGACPGDQPGGVHRCARWRQGVAPVAVDRQPVGTPGYVANEKFGSPEGGDIEGAKALLEESGETLPYPIKFTYPIGSDASREGLGGAQGVLRRGRLRRDARRSGPVWSLLRDRSRSRAPTAT